MIRKSTWLVKHLLELPARWAWLFVFAGLAGAFYLQFSPAFKSISVGLRYFLLLPILWLDIALYSLWGWIYGLQEKPKLNTFLVLLAVAAGILAVIGALISGRLWGFGHSPYTRHIPFLLGYLFYFSSVLIGLEIARAYLLARWVKKSPGMVFILIVIFFTLLVIPPGTYPKLLGGSSILFSFGKSILPLLSQSLLLTYLAWVGGPGMAILYRAAPLAFEWLSPVLPNPPWMASTFTNTLLPIIILLLINRTILWNEDQTDRQKSASYAWLYTVLFTAGLLWFNAGVLGMQTYLVAGGSMEPVLKAGDVVIMQKLDPEDIQIGDIILFNDSSKSVLHRVIKVNGSGEELEIITRGDSNKTSDAPVTIHQVKGKAIFKVPKIGWLSLQIKRIIKWLI